MHWYNGGLCRRAAWTHRRTRAIRWCQYLIGHNSRAMMRKFLHGTGAMYPFVSESNRLVLSDPLQVFDVLVTVFAPSHRPSLRPALCAKSAHHPSPPHPLHMTHSDASLRPFFDPLGPLAASKWLPTHDLSSTQQTRKMGCTGHQIPRRRVSFPPKPRAR